MQQFQDGDKQAFTEIYHRYAQRLLYFMYKMVGDREGIAQDLLHDVFAKLIEHPTSFNVQRSFKPWIFTVAANQCKKSMRGAPMVGLDVLHKQQDAQPSSIDHMHTSDFKQSLHRAMNQLSPDHRSVFVLRYIEHLSVKEISTVLSCAEGTVKSRLHYCTKKLANQLEEFNPLKA